MTPDEVVTTIRDYWINHGYDGVVVWWEKIQDYERHDHGSIPRTARFTIKSNIINGYPPRDKQ